MFVYLTTSCHLVMKWRMHGVLPPLSHTYSWHGAWSQRIETNAVHVQKYDVSVLLLLEHWFEEFVLHLFSSGAIRCKFCSWYSIGLFFVCFGRDTPHPSGPGPPHSRGFSWPHTTDTTQSLGLLWTSDQLVVQTSTWQHTTLNNRQTSMPPVGFEPAVSAGEWSQIYALDHAATGTGK